MRCIFFICELFSELNTEGVGVALFSAKTSVIGKTPIPFSSHLISTSLNSAVTFRTKSKLGLFLPESI